MYKGRDLTVSMLINLDTSSPNANTVATRQLLCNLIDYIIVDMIIIIICMITIITIVTIAFTALAPRGEPLQERGPRWAPAVPARGYL